MDYCEIVDFLALLGRISTGRQILPDFLKNFYNCFLLNSDLRKNLQMITGASPSKEPTKVWPAISSFSSVCKLSGSTKFRLVFTVLLTLQDQSFELWRYHYSLFHHDKQMLWSYSVIFCSLIFVCIEWKLSKPWQSTN